MTNAVLRQTARPTAPGFLRRFAGARHAAIAVEFALLAPLLALGAAGLAELDVGPAAAVEAQMVGSTIGDPGAQAALQAAPSR